MINKIIHITNNNNIYIIFSFLGLSHLVDQINSVLDMEHPVFTITKYSLSNIWGFNATL